LKVACPDFARLVVTNITPAAAREPYIELAAASLRTEIFSISLGFILLISSVGIPSTIIRASLFPIVVFPRTRIVPPLPGAPELRVTFNPATAPCNAFEICTACRFSIISPLTIPTAPVRSFLVLVP